MQLLSRYGLGVSLGAVVTVGLTLAMSNMIATDFVAQEVMEKQDFSINAIVEDITIIPDIKKPELLDKVEVPPAAPIIEKTAATSVVVNPVVIEQNSRLFDIKDLKITTVAVIPMDTNEQPLLRVPPPMPSRATKSGYCDVRFNVNAQGVPFDVETTYCTQSLFARPTIKSVTKWKYRPRIEDGQKTIRRGLINRVQFRLTDERGQLIPI